MARTYNEDNLTGVALTYEEDSLVTLIRNWSNRDAAALPDPIIQDCIKYAADEAYRDLRIVPLEHTIYYVITPEPETVFTQPGSAIRGTLITGATATNSIAQAVLPVPGDLLSYTHIRKVGSATETVDITIGSETTTYYDTYSNGNIKYTTTTAPDATVFNEKTDIRTFHDFCATKTSGYFWSRQGEQTIIAGTDLAAGDVIELHYHRRLPATYARYNINTLAYQATDDAGKLDILTNSMNSNTLVGLVENITNATTSSDGGITNTPLVTGMDTGPWFTNVLQTANNTVQITNNGVLETYRGILVPHWLRDENERVILFGALSEAFDYLGEEDMVQRFKQKFVNSVLELNREDKMRTATGGNTAIHYSSYLI